MESDDGGARADQQAHDFRRRCRKAFEELALPKLREEVAAAGPGAKEAAKVIAYYELATAREH